MRNTVRSRVERVLEEAKREARQHYNDMVNGSDPKAKQQSAKWCVNAQRTADLLEAILDYKDEDSMNKALRNIC